jgi:indole-3-glycerol phosphate synthase
MIDETMKVNSGHVLTFAVDHKILMELAVGMPKDVVMVAESGIRTAEDIARLHNVGYSAFLVGEALMRQPDPAAALALLLDREYSSDI